MKKRLCSLLLIIALIIVMMPMDFISVRAGQNGISKTSVSLKVGESLTLSVSGTTVKKWASSDAKCVAVDQYGKVFVKKKASKVVKITANCSNGKTYTCKVSTKAGKLLAYKDTEKNIVSTVLEKDYTLLEPKSKGNTKPYQDRFFDMTDSDYSYKIADDLSQRLDLALSLTISDKTSFSKSLPLGYDPDELLEWGKYPGLHVDILQKYGFTGDGSVVAYIDQPVEVDKNEQYQYANVHYYNDTKNKSSMHGPAVLSLLAGKDTGTAPYAEVYYYVEKFGDESQLSMAEHLYDVIEQNKKLSDAKKIKMVGFSDNIAYDEPYAKELEKAQKACEKAGIMVWWCGEYNGAMFLPGSDRNNFENLTWNGLYCMPRQNDGLVWVPAKGRTSATSEKGASYAYWAQDGGVSWTMPYMLGLYAIMIQIDPTLTQDEIRTFVTDTAYINSSGMRIVNPVELVGAVLDKVGRNEEAQAMRAEVKARNCYTYALMNTAEMDKKDITAVGEYLSAINDSTVLILDAAKYNDVTELYNAMKKDAKARGGKVVGVQIFGTPAAVPAFTVKYQALMGNNELDDMGTYLTDYFYSNLDNDPAKIDGKYSVYEQFSKGKNKADITPDWPVARLPLEKGKYADFFKKYKEYAVDTQLQPQTLVSFDNPIFASDYHIDEMTYFLNRMKSDYKLKLPYRLYANLDGDYPVKTKVLGNMTAENLTKENKKEAVEFLISTHGQKNNIDQATFKKGKEIRKSLINSDNINKVLKSNYYYLDLWTCNNAADMADNLVTTALEGKCLGAFADTTVISNNGVNCFASLDDMKKSNFFYFYYSYLMSLNSGNGRSTAFYDAQKAYAKVLLSDSKNKLRGEGNYQFNLNNLLSYVNMGVLDSNPLTYVSFTVDTSIVKTDKSKVENQSSGNNGGANGGQQVTIKKTKGKAKGEAFDIPVSGEYVTSGFEVTSITGQLLDNDYYRFHVKYKGAKNSSVFIFNPPQGDVYKYSAMTSKKGSGTLEFDVKKKDFEKGQNFLTLSFTIGNEMNFVFFSYTP